MDNSNNIITKIRRLQLITAIKTLYLFDGTIDFNTFNYHIQH